MSVAIGDWQESIQTIEGRIYRIIFDRAHKKNAFTPRLYAEVKAGILFADAHAEVEVIIVEGSDGVFSSGGDIKVLFDIIEAAPEEQLARFIEAYEEPLPFQTVLDCTKPVIAKIDGLSLAGGMIFAAVADAAIASDRSVFGVPEARVGLADPFCPVLLPGLVGHARARYLMMTSHRLDAQTAVDWGLILKAVPLDELESAVQEVAREFMSTSRDARRIYKRNANKAYPHMSPLVVLEAARTENGYEGLAAFRDRRPPKWDLSG